MRIKSRILAVFLGTALLATGLPYAAAAEETAPPPSADQSAGGEMNYFNYYNTYKDAPRPQGEILINGAEFQAAEKTDAETSIQTADQKPLTGVVLEEEGNRWAEWSLEVPESGVYSLYMSYYPLEANGKDLEFSLLLDGRRPFSETATMTLPRLWRDKVLENGSTIRQDDNGNDPRPTQEEAPRLYTKALQDTQGLYSEPYLFYLEAGTHVLRIDMGLESMLLHTIAVRNQEELRSYEEYRALHADAPVVKGETIRIEAENTLEKTSSSIYPTEDRGSAATEPHDPSRQRLNTIGQGNWAFPGERLTWGVKVPETGWYKLAFRAKQSESEGMNSYRILYINGEIPFAGAEALSFPFRDDWYVQELESYIYLEAGKVNTISLECTSAKMSGPLRDIQQAVLDLNVLYRKIIVITGASPDTYRDYQLQKEIPELIDSLTAAKTLLAQVSEEIKTLTGSTGSQASIVDEVLVLLDDFIAKPHTISQRLSKFKEDLEALASIIMDLSEQPLELDCIAVVPEGGVLPRERAGFFEDLYFGLQKFLHSFTDDYSAIGASSEGDNVVTVWCSGGRDQAKIIKRLVDDSFSTTYDIPINLNIVDTASTPTGSTLVQAVLAGRGPDVALLVTKDTPVNLAMRGALVDLSDPRFDLDEIQKTTFPSAWIPFQYNGGIYAVPESQVFDMLFYRTDIFEELDLTPPETWEDFYKMMQVLQNNNLQVGIGEIDPTNQGVSAGIAQFNKFLYQNGGQYYTDKLDRTLFDTDVAYEAFEKWAELYTKYKLDRSFDFFNRFRSGEMPVGIAAYTTYNQLAVAAPELAGLWDFALIPGTRREDGTIDRTQTSNGTGSIMLAAAEEHGVAQEAFTFLKWWTSTEVQAEYAKELEMTMGVAARHTPANVEAFKTVGWTKAEQTLLLEQWNWVTEVPQIPGNYTVSRSLTSALRAAIDNGTSPRRELSIYNKEINSEIKRKRQEFDLE